MDQNNVMIKVVPNFFVVFVAHMSIMFIIKVKTLELIKRAYM